MTSPILFAGDFSFGQIKEIARKAEADENQTGDKKFSASILNGSCQVRENGAAAMTGLDQQALHQMTKVKIRRAVKSLNVSMVRTILDDGFDID